MASKTSSPGPNVTATAPTKAARSRKAAATKQDTDTNAGRAGSAGGVVLEQEKKNKGVSNTVTPATKTTPTDNATEAAGNKTRRKPRKLNKEPTPSTPAATDNAATDLAAAAELEALKSRVRGLEAKVEELYKSGPSQSSSNRSPRRRGKGRKNSSAQSVPTLASTSNANKSSINDEDRVVEVDDAEESADEELTRLESELAVAKQDLQRYRPRNRRSRSGQTSTSYLDDDVEEIQREAPGVETSDGGTTRQVTLSGSYRIPLPASVNTEDLKTIQSGVSAAQNLARGFLEQRRANQVNQQNTSNTTSTSTSKPAPKRSTTKPTRPQPRQAKSMSSNMEIIQADDGSGGKQSWSEWIGGYSMAISRAVKNIEHEAMVESQNAGAVPRKAATGGTKKAGAGGSAGKRPAAKAKMSTEQVDGLMR